MMKVILLVLAMSSGAIAGEAPSGRRVICPACKVAGKKSTVRQDAPAPYWSSNIVLTTSGYAAPSDHEDGEFYDEDGARHVHNDSDKRIHRFTCSSHHRFKISPELCWCGWGKCEDGEAIVSVATSHLVEEDIYKLPAETSKAVKP